MPIRTLFIFSLLGLLISGSVYSQQSDAINHIDKDFQTALHLYKREKYGASIKHFNSVIQRINNNKNELYVDATFYTAMAGYHLYNNDAEFKLVLFLKEFPESMHANQAAFTLGNLHYRNRKYQKAIEWLNQVDLFPLSASEKQDFYFKRGICYVNLKENDKALSDFFEIKDQPGPYFETANYYFAHINYDKKNYQTALKTFKKIEETETFSSITPFYIAQIYYLQNNYDSLIVFAEPILQNEEVKEKGEIARLVGESYYRKENYEKALPYLEIYKSEVNNTNRIDKFQLGYTYYKTGKLDKAEKEFSLVDTESDSLSQAAVYFLADVYVQQERNNYAKNAFKKAANLKFDPIIEEDALFNYGRFAYLTSNDPFNEAAKAFKDYAAKYPKNQRAQEAFTYLVNIYMRTGRYEEGLNELEKVQDKDQKLKEAYQTLAFNRGVQLFKVREFENAISFFNKAKLYNTNPQIFAESVFWIADCQYHLGNNIEAANTWKNFQTTNGAFLSPLYNLAYYNAGYALYKEKDYKNASTFFRQYTARTDEKDTLRLNDATLRIADYFYLEKDYNRAIENYLKALNYTKKNTDYAYFQIAVCYGFDDNATLEQNYFKKVIENGKNSKYYLDSRYRMGYSYLRSNQDSEALEQFTKITEEYPTSSYVKRSLLQIGLIHSRARNTENALAAFKKVVDDFPSDQDTKDALAAIKNIYVNQGNIDEFNAFVSGRTDFSVSELDSANYMAAEQKMFKNDPCVNIVSAFSKYLADFPNAIFAVNARFYRAECYARLNEYEKALEDYFFVTNTPVSNFSEPAYFAGATLAYEQQDYNQAYTLYQGLENVAQYRANIVEAQIGQMRCLYRIGNYEKAIEYANISLEASETPAEIKQEASFLIAESLLMQNKLEQAREAYTLLAEQYQNKTGAESLYKVAQISYQLADFNAVEELVFKLIQRFPTFDLYKVKGLILLAKSYVELSDSFQAKATLQSIIDAEEALRELLLPADADTLIDEAKTLYESIELEQLKVNEKSETKGAEIDIKSDDIDQKERERLIRQMPNLEEIEQLEKSARENKEPINEEE